MTDPIIERLIGENFVPILERLKNTEGMAFSTDQRYSCLKCRDHGWAPVWHPNTLDEVRKLHQSGDDIEKANWKQVMTRCICDAAYLGEDDGFRSGPRAGKPVPRFGSEHWHISTYAADTKSQVASHKPENFNDDFAAFSRPVMSYGQEDETEAQAEVELPEFQDPGFDSSEYGGFENDYDF